MALDGKEYELPVVVGSEGEVGIDIAQLRAKTGAITFDPGYGNTGACESAVTFIDGEAGILRYRGYPIEEIAGRARFTEICFLLIYERLPNAQELKEFEDRLTYHTMIHEDMKKFFEGFPSSAHPMAMLSSMIVSLSTYYPNDGHDDLDLNIARLLAKGPTIAAASYKKIMGQPSVYPRNDLSYCSNFLHMMFSVPAEPYVVRSVLDRALNLLLILHADHEQNCSTSTVRMVGSSQANLFASLSAGVSALWGPLHGGANQAVIEMLQRIRDDHGDYKKYVDLAKDKTSGFKLMGFGHRVYKNFDPRAKILKATVDEVLAELGVSDPLLEIARALEEVALRDDFFISRKLYPNVDFYSGIIYRAMGIPTNMFTVLFALGRMPGWIAHWREMLHDPKNRINRPRQIYIGPTQRPFVPLDQR
ncbi:MAG TPA: citrate synthase [Thermoanaerobaculia bacterium]|nr:citrate synthase [Thermoanaerobaculia bacterium]